ncbi:MAG TPA: DUF2141 domain-containing protein [Caulobacteraceae bacterium]|jgi:uncharacterized protein (DUF2141 family)|nr:DUF2141 domain-containing protein [Caulobacteraceae bacterium]
MKSRAAFILVGVALLAAQSARAADIEVDVTGVEQARGHVRVAICTQDTFLKQSCPYEGAAAATPGVTVVKVDGVRPGVYAAQVFHDDTDAGVVHQNLLGIPREAVGFSNDAPLHLSGPRFSEAAFQVRASAARITLKLRRLLGGHAQPPRQLAQGR